MEHADCRRRSGGAVRARPVRSLARTLARWPRRADRARRSAGACAGRAGEGRRPRLAQHVVIGRSSMPVKIKLALSLLVVLVTAIVVYYQHSLGHDRIQYVVAFLGAFMIFAMWLFPEVKREESAGGVRDTAGR